MTIPRPTFILIDACPDWGTADHDKVDFEPGEHETQLVLSGDPDRGLSVDLVASADHGLEVVVWLEGERVLKVSADDAPHRLVELVRVVLTAVHRLDLIEGAEKSVAGIHTADLSYNFGFDPEPLSIKQAGQLLYAFKPNAHAPNAAGREDREARA